MDFLHYGVELFFHKKLFLLSLVVLSIHGLYLYAFCKILFLFVIIILQLAVVESYVLSGMMHRLLAISKVHMSLFNRNTPRVCKRCNYKIQNDLLNSHSCLKILEIICNEVYWCLLPQLLLLGGLSLIFTNYGTIRMHSVIPLPYYLGYALLASLIVLIFLTLFPTCSKFMKTLNAFWALWKI